MLEIGALAVLVAGASYGYSLYQKSRAHARFKLVFEEIARKLGGRASPGTIFDAPELRVSVGGVDVLLKLRGIENPERGVAIIEVPLEGPVPNEMLRLYVGWDVSSVPRGLEHIPEIPFPRVALDGRIAVRASDAAIATRFVERATPALSDIRREARARAMEVLCRGGTLQLAVHGIKDSASVLERIVFAALHMRDLVYARGESKGEEQTPRSPASPSPPPAAAPSADPVRVEEEPIEDVACTLCVDKRKRGEAWVRCTRCRAPYHRTCFLQATGCIEKGCHETRSVPFEKAER